MSTFNLKHIFLGVHVTHVRVFGPRQLLICAPIPGIAPVGDRDTSACHLDRPVDRPRVQHSISDFIPARTHMRAAISPPCCLSFLSAFFIYAALPFGNKKNWGYPEPRTHPDFEVRHL